MRINRGVSVYAFQIGIVDHLKISFLPSNESFCSSFFSISPLIAGIEVAIQ